MEFPLSFFAFPLNLILLILWVCLVVHWRKKVKLSSWLTLSAIIIFLVIALVVGFTGNRDILKSWPVVLFLLYFQTVLLLVVLRGWSTRRWRFVLNHLGLLIALGAAYWGAPDEQVLRVQAVREEAVTEAFTMGGNKKQLPYEIVLKDFVLHTDENGVPSMYQADLLIDQMPVTLKVNHPYQRNFAETLYLSSYDHKGEYEIRYCVIQIVKQPWRYLILLGIIMMIAGAFLLFIKGPVRRKESKQVEN